MICPKLVLCWQSQPEIPHVDLSSTAALVAQGMFKTVAVPLATTVRRFGVKQENLKWYWK